MYLFAPSFLNRHFLSTNYQSVTQVDPGSPEKLTVQCGDRQELVPQDMKGYHWGCTEGVLPGGKAACPVLQGSLVRAGL